MKGAQKETRLYLGIPPAKIDEDPYGEAQKQAAKVVLPSVPAPSRQQTEETAQIRMKNELEQRHSLRGRILPRELVSRLEKNAVKIYGEAREAALKRVETTEKEKGFELTGGQKIKIMAEEYSFAVLREMDAYYGPEAEKRVDAVLKTLGKEDRKAVGKMREALVLQMSRRLALNPQESLKAGEVEEAVWAVNKLSRTIEAMYGRDSKLVPREELNARAIEIYKESREKAREEIARIEKNGGQLSNGQKIIMWELEYRKMVQVEVKKISG